MMEQFFNTNYNGESVGPDYIDNGNVGPQTGGTYDIPATAQQSNLPWDTPGAVRGQYGSDVLGILSQGIGVWSQYAQTNQMLDYRRYEATNGGVYAQGRPAGQMAATGRVQVSGNSNMLLLLLIGGAFLLLNK